MRLSIFRIILWLLAGLPLPLLAAHQVGGQLEMQAIGNMPGHYRVVVTNYFEAGTKADEQTGGLLGIFQKRDNTQRATFYARRTGDSKPILFSNEYCATFRNLNFVTVLYQAEIQLNPADYIDPQGYYISYQSRARNDDINNIRKSGETGFAFYLEFPALQKNGQAIAYSSPHFPPVNGEYICLGDRFTFPFGATDPDGDELRYSLVTPLNQRDAENATNPVSAGPYPGISWQPGFSAANAIPGNPSLSIHARTGQLSVRATQAGLYLFGVNVEKFRSGVKLGEVRRDFQFLVIDCPTATMPSPSIQLLNKPPGSTQATICRGDSAILQTVANSDYHYQWRRNGINLPAATEASLTVVQAGEYTVVVSKKNDCVKPGISAPVTIQTASLSGKVAKNGHLCALGGSVRMRVNSQARVRYQWFRDGKALSGKSTDSIQVNQEGRYWASLTDPAVGCVFTTDTVSITRLPPKPATIRSVSGRHRLCPQDSLLLAGSDGIRYSWQRNDQPVPNATGAQLWVKTAGSYVVTATGGDGCQQVSAPFVVESVPAITAVLDAVPAICDSTSQPVILSGSPPGGEFTGPGVSGNLFYPQQAGLGTHQLTYSVRAGPECAAATATRTVVVTRRPTVELPSNLVTYKGNTLPLTPVVTGDAISFRWAPETYLDNPLISNPLAIGIANAITYTLTVETNAGCTAQDTVHIAVYDQVWVPDAFTPNGDGLNDVLVLPGIDAFPDAIITIFNRWGHVVFQSQKGYPVPFDGTVNGVALPAGVYPYTLSILPNRPIVTGRLMILK